MENLEVRMIIEIMGKPAEHLMETMKLLVDRLDKENGVSLKEVKVHDPIEVKEAKGFYSTFAEIEAEFENVGVFLGIIFAYLPSNIEIINPAKVTIPTESLNVLGNNLIARMHSYDAIVKKIMVDKEILTKQLAAVQGKSENKEETKDKKKKSK